MFPVDIFSRKRLKLCTLHYFSALTNVRELGIDRLDIPSFMPRIQRYFGHFLPAVQSLSLRTPKGSRRQIVYFIGLFQHLEDLKLLHDDMTGPPEEESADDQTLIPCFVPPLRGQLTMTWFTRVGILRDMINLFGGVRFHHADLYDVDETRLLLGACARTLETLRLYPTDPRGKRFLLNKMWVLTDNIVAVPSLRYFDLSRNESLRILQVTARSIDGALWNSSSDAVTSLLTYALSTITSSAFSELAIFYRDYDFRGIHYLPLDRFYYRMMSPAEIVEEARHSRLFEVFRKMYKVRDFRLVLCVDVWDNVGEYSVRMLKEAVATEKAKGGFDDLSSEPVVPYSPWTS